MFDLNDLPVAPEFASVLKETATQTAVECLRVLCVPERVISLVQEIDSLGYYIQLCYEDPEHLQAQALRHFGIEDIVIETVNNIAACGGTFAGTGSYSVPRPFHPRRLRRAEKQVERVNV